MSALTMLRAKIENFAVTERRGDSTMYALMPHHEYDALMIERDIFAFVITHNQVVIDGAVIVPTDRVRSIRIVQ